MQRPGTHVTIVPDPPTIGFVTVKPLLVMILAGVAATAPLSLTSQAADEPWITFDGNDGPGRGKHIVLVSGDEEYRSEETLPQLAKILATRQGFRCTVLFAIDPKTGQID